MKQEIKKLSTYIKRLNELANIVPSDLKGYEKTTDEEKKVLSFSFGSLANDYGALKHLCKKQ